MRFQTLSAWLEYIQSVHPSKVEFGLERVCTVAKRLNLLHPACPVITVAGTNGKGSCVAGLEAIYLAEGYRVGAFTTPYLFKHNEEVRIQGLNADDMAFCESFERIEIARGDISLTYFEFNTLAALDIFKRANLDVYLLEVGLGGRLDAVNIIDADLAVIASIGIDHVNLLGDTRELIAKEKACVFRPEKPAVYGDLTPPQSLQDYAAEHDVQLFRQGVDFHYTQNATNWSWESEFVFYENLPLPSLTLQNMSTVLMAITLMQRFLPVKKPAIEQGLSRVKLPGRIQLFPGVVTRIFDVSHNPAAAELLTKTLETLPHQGKIHAVFSMLSDKDIVGTIQIMKNFIDDWYIAPLAVERGTPIDILRETFRVAEVTSVSTYGNIAKAYEAAMNNAKPHDCVVVFGSFYTVAGVTSQLL